jgi:hypothetical protein
MVVHACNPSYSRVGGRRIANLRPVRSKKARPYLRNEIQTKELGYGSSDRALA